MPYRRALLVAEVFMPPATGLFCAAPTACPTPRRWPRVCPALIVRPPAAGYWLELDEARLSLLNPDKHGRCTPNLSRARRRIARQFGGGRGQPVAKAIGMKGQPAGTWWTPPPAWAATPLCWPAWAAPCAWSSARQWPPRCWPTRWRARMPPDTADIAARMTVIHADASDWLASLAPEARPQVVFVDPMFPDTGNKAAAKKTCRRFRR